MKFKFYIYILAAMMVFGRAHAVFGAISAGGVVVTAAATGDSYGSPASGYYFNAGAGAPYDFTVTVATNEGLYTGVTNVTLTIPATVPITISIAPTGNGTFAATMGGGDAGGSATCTISGTSLAMTLVFHYTPSAAVSEIANASHNITASATSDDPNTENSAVFPATYGIVNTGITAGDVVVTGADAGDLYGSPASGYYFNTGATQPYDFTFTVRADGHDWGCISDVRLTITSGAAIVLSVTPPAGVGATANVVMTASGGDGAGATATCDFPAWVVGGVMTITVHYRPSTTVSEIVNGSHNITARATSVFDAGPVTSAALPSVYGIVSTGITAGDVVVTGADAGDLYGSPASGYYFNTGATQPYDFTFTVRADGHDWGCISDVRLTITSGAAIVLSVTPPAGVGATANVVMTAGGGDGAGATATCDFPAWVVGGVMTITVHYRPSTTVSEIVNGSHNITARATSVFDAGPVTSAALPSVYGIVSTGITAGDVVVTGADAGDLYGSPASGYYFNTGATQPYDFTFTVRADGHDWGCISDVRLTITSGAAIVLSVTPPAGVGATANVVMTAGGGDGAGATATCDFPAWVVGGVMTITVHYRPSTTVSEIVNGSHNITARATSVFDAGPVTSAALPSVYGIVSTGITAGDVVVTGADAGDLYGSPASGYYFNTGATQPYDFTFTVRADGHDWGCISDVRLTITSGAAIVLSVTPPAGVGATANVVMTASGGDGAGATATCDFPAWVVGGVMTITVHYRPSTTVSEIVNGSHNITARATSVFDAGPVTSAALPSVYGIVSTGITAGDVVVTGADAGDLYGSPASGYYFNTGATQPYDFTFTVRADGHDWGCISDVRLTITSGAAIVLSVTPPAGVGATANVVMTAGGGDGAGATATCDFPAWVVGGVMTITVHYRPSTTVSEIVNGSHNITARATSVFDAGFVTSVAFPATYGIVNTGITAGDVVVTGADAGDLYGAPASGYYFNTGATQPYDFTFTVRADGHDWDCISDVRLTIPSGTAITLTATPPAGVGATAGVVMTVGGGDGAGATATCDFPAWVVGGVMTITVHYRPSTTVSEIANGSNNITARATSVFDAGFVTSVAFPATYGIVNTGITAGDVVVTGADAGDLYGNPLRGYYLNTGATQPYDFTFTVRADGHDWDCISDVRLTIPSGTAITLTATPPAGVGATTGVVMTVGGGDGAGATATCDFPAWVVGGVMTITVHYRPSTTVSEIANGSNNITARATSAFDAASVTSVAFPATYGIVNTGITAGDVIVTGADAGDLFGAPASGYYFNTGATAPYDFTFTVRADGHNWSCLSDLRLTITSGAVITLSVTPPAVAGPIAGVAMTASGGDGAGAIATCDLPVWVSGAVMTITVHYRPSTTVTEIANGSHNITSRATSVFDAGPVTSGAFPATYGIVNTGITAGDVVVTAADSGDNYGGLGYYMGNGGTTAPYDFTFTVRADGHDWDCISNITLTIPATIPITFSVAPPSGTGATAGVVMTVGGGDGAGAVATCDFPVWVVGGVMTITVHYTPSNTVSAIASGSHSINASAFSVFDAAAVSNSLSATYGICRRFNFAVLISGGGGVNAPVYIRNAFIPGTSFQLQIQNDPAGVPIDFTQVNQLSITYNYGGLGRSTVFTLPVLNPPVGIITSNIVEIQNPSGTEVAANNTIPFNAYNIGTISSGAWNSNLAVAFAAQLAVVYASPTIRWDNLDPPGALSTVPIVGIKTADSIQISWSTLSMAPALNDADFYSYRIYYRVNGSSTWRMIDSALYPGLLDNIATASFIIVNLQALTAYDFYITAIDIFGNETASSGLFGSDTTLPSTSTETISDGITTYEDSSFTMNPLDRPLRDSSIKIEINVVGASQPDSLNLIFASNAAPDLVAAGALALIQNTDYASYNPLTQYFKIETLKTSPNKWVGFISSENPLITPGQDSKFILEAIKGGVPVYYDHSNDPDPNNDEWTFTIINPPKVTPWPTRVLNNVITDENPVAYPAYYLTDDANVTITAYDIKGRIVEVLLDNAPRKSGINIRENGWRGTNKAGRKLGVGLYYLHIKAKRQSDGKTIIDKFSKVVMAR